METKVTSINQEVIISSERPTILIGERINPTGRKRLSASLLRGDMEIICQEAISQVEAGADILDVNVGASGVDEVTMLPKAVRAVMGVVDAPLSLDSDNPKAIAAASLNSILPLVKEYCASVIGLTMDEDGIPTDATRRLEIAKRIVDRAERLKIPREDVIIDCLVTTVSTDDRTAAVTLEAIRKVSVELNVNQTIGTSNISFGLPERETLNTAFLVLAIGSGVTCPCANVAKVRQSVLATDLLLGKDPYSSRYIKGYRQMPSRGK
jgi:5-methyltetrahydrofolate--homocysteine methyltransferase